VTIRPMSKGGDRRKSFVCLQQLARQFPAAFLIDGPRKPLKIGIRDDLALRWIGRDVLQRGLAVYCSNYHYLLALQEGAVRIGLDGEPAGVVTADAAASARQKLAEERKLWQQQQAEKRLRQQQLAEKKQPKPKPNPPPEAPPKAKPAHKLSTPFRKPSTTGRAADDKIVVVEVRRGPSWRSLRRRVIDLTAPPTRRP
jgi:ProP effector